jgi:RNA polymerase sigma factor (sigma-70 family)
MTDHADARDLPASMRDDRLVDQCLKGSEEAWSALIDKYKRLIFSIPVRQGLSADDSSEIFQEVCLTLLSELPQLRKPGAVCAWLIQMTSHKCFHKRKEQQRYVTAETAEDPPALIEERQTPHDVLYQVEREQIVREALSELSPRCRRLIQFLFFEDPAVSYEEAAKSLGLAKGSIGFIRMRCLERLRRSLEEKGF